MKKKALSLLKDLTEAPGAPGREDDIRSLFCKELGGDLSCDKTGSVIQSPAARKGPRIMITGHMDEVAFAVQNITPDGFLRFTTLGGWWGHTLLSQRVTVQCSTGAEITGLITSVPVHFLSDSDRKSVLPVDKMFIDIGASSRTEAESFGVRVGDPIIPCSSFERMHNPSLLMAKAFDNRVGMALTIQATQELRKAELPNQLFAVGTVQEEVGTRGAQTATRLVKPDVALVMEGAPADDTPGNSAADAQGALGKGVQIRILDPTTIMNRRLVNLVRETAEKAKIPHQLAVRTSGGTDGRPIHLSGEGVPTVVLGVPARYIHSHNSIINIDDYMSALKLAMAVVKRLDQKTVDHLTDFLSK